MTAGILSALPSERTILERLENAECGEGWAARCAAEVTYLAPSAELVCALAALLKRVSRGSSPLLEVCAGDGTLAASLRGCGVDVIASDIAAPVEAIAVTALAAADALARYTPRVVLGAFIPVDSGVDEAVFSQRYVSDYVVLGTHARASYERAHRRACPGWTMLPLPQISSRMITRHDIWLGGHRPVQRCGEAWWFHRENFTDAGDQPAIFN